MDIFKTTGILVIMVTLALRLSHSCREYHAVFDATGRRLCVVGIADRVYSRDNIQIAECAGLCEEHRGCALFNIIASTTCELFACPSNHTSYYHINSFCSAFKDSSYTLGQYSLEDELGYALYQRRVDLSFVFNQTWAPYRNGFGNICGNFWLGNEPVYQMTSKNSPCSLRLEMGPIDFSSRYVVDYLSFYLASETSFYALNVSGFLGDAAKDALTPLNAMPFSTIDSWHSSCFPYNCPKQLGEGWWFKCCYEVLYVPSYTWHENFGGELKFYSMWVKCPR